ncbi:MAG: MCE family protein, partial [Methylococcaceae bacterium]|nr:MCE family protein [Methylococcaceae bacterium]
MEPMNSNDQLPPPVSVRPAGRFSLPVVWIIPLVAALIGGWLVWKSVSERGPTITIVFKNAEGLEPGKTTIKYRDVEVGKLVDLQLSKDRQSVIATAELRSGTDGWLFEDTRFWVVRPRVVAGNISGLSTLLSGVYIGMDVGSTGAHIHDFRGLDVAPLLTSDRVGKRFVLKSEELGSLDVGAPIYFRHIKVGQILAYEMDADGSGVTLQAFVEAPYDRYVTRDSRFWQASGLDVSVDANGIKLDSESLLTLVIGGLAFGPRYGSIDTEPAPADSVYTLIDKRAKALAPPKVESRSFVLYFNESLRGLTVGAPVDFRGLQLGEVSGVRGEYDPERRTLKAVVDVALIWDIVVRKKHGEEMHLSGEPLREQIQHMVDKGFRAQLRSGNLLAGQLYVALDFFPDAKPTAIDWNSETPEFPTMPGALASLSENVSNLFKKIDKLPLDETTAEVRQAIRSLDQALRSTDRLVTGLDREVMPEARAALIQVKRPLDEAQKPMAADGPLQHDARDALAEVTRAAQSLRVLMDYLDRHPESL